MTASEADPRRMTARALGALGPLCALDGWALYLAPPGGGPPSPRPSFCLRPRLFRDLAPTAAGRIPGRTSVALRCRGRLVGVVALHARGRDARLAPSLERMLRGLLEPLAVAIDAALLLKKSQELSVTDDLTHLFNVRYQNAALRREVSRSRRYRVPVSLIFLDLDGFKSVNDQHGHLWGSRTLVEVGAVIRSVVREIDVVSRFGGDEFTVILPQTDARGAKVIAERLRQRIASTIFLRAHGLEVKVTASFGIATYPDHGRTEEDLVTRADQAMYAAKEAGKNRVQSARNAPIPAIA
ncbi:MAG TPA: GGDEF domain-containing protein [Candidatus Polarisedimenticolia bacterium]|nr:GGDEF domain-containing protein [Candidatus Polarisedimenticolia bacterium]